MMFQQFRNKLLQAICGVCMAFMLWATPVSAAPYGSGSYGGCDYNSTVCSSTSSPPSGGSTSGNNTGGALAHTGEPAILYSVGAVTIIIIAGLIFLKRPRKK